MNSEARPYHAIPVDDWLCALKLAIHFQMEDVQQFIVGHLDALPLDPIRKIAIWEEYHLNPEMLHPSYAVLCQRLEPLTLSMTMSLGLKNFTKLAAARDEFHRHVGCGTCMHGTFKERHAIAGEIVTRIFAKSVVLAKQPIKDKASCA